MGRPKEFDPEEALELMARHRVRNVFLPPTALRMLRAAECPGKRKLDLRTLASGGESLGAELLHWSRETFGLTINEFYGQTECNMTVGWRPICKPRSPIFNSWSATKGLAATASITALGSKDFQPRMNIWVCRRLT